MTYTDKKSIYDLHLSIMHDYVKRTESFLVDIKQEPKDTELGIDLSNDSTTSAIVPKNIKNFACKTCKKKFNKSGDLKRHEIIHTGKKHFGCKVCDQKFYRSDSLKKHLKIHAGEKSFACKYCFITLFI